MHRRPTTQDISWFLDQARNKQLNLAPPYQRRSVWTMKDRRFFLDTIFKGYPCPAVFLHKRVDPDGRAVYDVVDGKQRLETILMYANNKISIDSEFNDTRLAGKKWKDLGDDERHIFWNYILPVEQLDFGPNETDTVNDAFDRLNRNSRKLDRQELRHARYEGWFISQAEIECAQPVWKTFGVVTNARAKRMKDSQFLSELLLVLIEKRQVGFDQDYLDESYAKYDDPDEEDVELDTDDVAARLEAAKAYLVEMNDENQCVRTAGAQVGAFYTLWSLVVLHRNKLPPAKELAPKYAAFVAKASAMRKEGATAILGNPPSEIDLLADKYGRALQGAHTDLGPRNTRLEALLAAMQTP